MKPLSKTNIVKVVYLEPYQFGMDSAIKLHLVLDRSIIVKILPEVGFLHRASEKIMENKIYLQNIVYMDQIDCTASIINEHAYVLAIEKMLNIVPPIRAQYIRVMLDELTRISSHLLWLSSYTAALEIKLITLDCLQLREEILYCLEAITGHRINLNYYRPGGVYQDLPTNIASFQCRSFQQVKKKFVHSQATKTLLDIIWDFTERLPHKLDFYVDILNKDPTWKQQTIDVGVLSAENAISLGFSGPNLRASGVAWDLRKTQAYAIYQQLKFNIVVTSKGDNYDRYLVRIAEMRESNSIVRQTIVWLKNHLGPVMLDNYKIVNPKRDLAYNNLGSLIHHMKLFGEGFCLPVGECYAAVENPKGEFGVYLVSDGANKAYRIKIRTPSFAHLAGLEQLLIGRKLSELTAILGSYNIVTGEIDR